MDYSNCFSGSTYDIETRISSADFSCLATDEEEDEKEVALVVAIADDDKVRISLKKIKKQFDFFFQGGRIRSPRQSSVAASERALGPRRQKVKKIKVTVAVV